MPFGLVLSEGVPEDHPGLAVDVLDGENGMGVPRYDAPLDSDRSARDAATIARPSPCPARSSSPSPAAEWSREKVALDGHPVNAERASPGTPAWSEPWLPDRAEKAFSRRGTHSSVGSVR